MLLQVGAKSVTSIQSRSSAEIVMCMYCTARGEERLLYFTALLYRRLTALLKGAGMGSLITLNLILVPFVLMNAHRAVSLKPEHCSWTRTEKIRIYSSELS